MTSTLDRRSFGLDGGHGAAIPETLPHLAEWPRVESLVRRDEAVERRVADLLATMSLAEKVGQITQPEIQSISPDEVRDHHIGSILNGGGSWPGRKKQATPAEWVAAADAYWQASVDGSTAGIPLVWGIDSVRGNTHAFGGTLFPHNVGLGAARNPALVREIGAATARQTRATGQDWVFAPCLAVPQDYRWGRTYEGYSGDPRLVLAYGYEAVIGLQGDSPAGPTGDGVIATAKHYIGDGATEGGRDQGVAAVSEDVMRNVHAQGYYGALAAGAQTVMASFNSWDAAAEGIAEGKLHGSHYALTTILKDRLGFDGVVVSDWNGVGQVGGCTNASCARAINAGIDVVMVPTDWKDFLTNTIAQVESGEIPMERLDDAVARILRVKIRAGVLDAPKPSERALAGDPSALDARELARRAVRESLVLLKDDADVLPLARSARVLVVGE
ncbi:MAG: glycoside hydrolase family 3 protein, partial [Actinomycetota bacterium]|nr:glycoside hydrolase family 3 protein [Actinomycetota bacterium]